MDIIRLPGTGLDVSRILLGWCGFWWFVYVLGSLNAWGEHILDRYNFFVETAYPPAHPLYGFLLAFGVPVFARLAKHLQWPDLRWLAYAVWPGLLYSLLCILLQLDNSLLQIPGELVWLAFIALWLASECLLRDGGREAWLLPEENSAMGVRRYGYHGISYESIVLQLQPNVPEKLIVAHLGNGASISAIRGGKCLDTSMGLTPTGGIISGSRTGDIDPGVLLFILRKIAETETNVGKAADKLEIAVGKKAGLLGVSELSNDMRDLRDAIKEGNAKARLAVDKFTWTIAKWIGSYVAELGGLGMLVFTGGIGENDIASRAEICAGLGALGIVLDAKRNNVRGEATISAENSAVTVRVIPPAEDLIIVNHVVRLLAE